MNDYKIFLGDNCGDMYDYKRYLCASNVEEAMKKCEGLKVEKTDIIVDIIKL